MAKPNPPKPDAKPMPKPKTPNPALPDERGGRPGGTKKK